MDERRCDVELIDTEPGDGFLLVRALRINGQAVYMPGDAKVSIDAEAGGASPVVLSIELLPTSVVISGEPPTST